MKKILLFASVLIITQASFAQEKGTNEIQLSVGALSTNDFVSIFGDVLTSTFSGGTVTYENVSSTPSFGLTFKHAIKDRWMLYGEAVAQFASKDVFYNQNVKDGNVKNTYLTLGIGTDYHYVSKDWFQMYSGLSAGYTIQMWNYSSSNPDLRDGNAGYFNFQVNALGFRFGKKLAISAELGFGYKGIAVGGISYQF